MRRRVPLLFLLLAVTALTGVWMLHQATPDDASLTDQTRATTAATMATERASSAARAERQIVAAAETERARPQQAIIDAEFAVTATPAADAEVWFWPPRNAAERGRDGQLHHELDDLELALRRHGRMARTDARGRATIEADPGSEVVVRAGDHYGELELSSADGPRQVPEHVLLLPDRSLRVLVVDTHDQPRPGLTVDASIEGNTSTFGPTDTRGLATLRHLQLRTHIPPANDADWSIDVRCNGLHLRSTARRVSASELLGNEPIRLVLPESGEIEIAIVDQDGADVRTFATLGDDTIDLYCTTDRNSNPRVYYGVPLGRTFRVSGSSGNFGSVVGPKVAGERVRARLVVKRATFEFTGRIARRDHRTLDHCRATIHGEFVGSDTPRTRLSATATPEADGRFVCRLERIGTTGELVAPRLEIHAQSLPRPHEQPLADRFAPGEHDLGDLIVPVPDGEQLLVAVEVHDGGRSLIAQTALSVWTLRQDRRVTLPLRIEHQAGQARMFGVPSDRPMELHCSHPGYVPAVVPFEIGARTTVALEPAARLWFVTIPPPIPDHLLQCTLTPTDDPQGRDHYANGERGRNVWQQLRPGRYRLSVTALGRTIFAAPAVDLVAGDNVWPRDGSRVDLRGRLAAARVAVRSAHDGTLLDDAGILAVPSGTAVLGEDWVSQITSRWLALPGEPIDVLVRAEGFVPRRLPRVSADITIRLRPRTTLELVPPPGETVDVRVHVAADGVTDPALRTFDNFHDHDDQEWASMREPFTITQPAGTILRVAVVRGEVAGTPQQILVGESSPQRVLLH